ncbi:MAG: monodechloroaminopyrrolnitrin synthase PrnB family protein, partial [Woeseiaceae bacterium]
MGITTNVAAFDNWTRTSFRDMNTELEEMYFAQENKANVQSVGDSVKKQLLEEGRTYIVDLLEEGNTDEGFDSNFELLGDVGLYMGACRRHEITEPSRETKSPLIEASALALQLGASLGVTPRFATSHLSTHNYAHSGVYKSFTSLEAEYVFLDYNTRGVFAYKRAADALFRILPLGVSHPVTCDLLLAAKNALMDVIAYNDTLYEKLDTDRFFYCVRPYYKPYRVGLHEYRGANAGDFAGINVIDLLLG